MEEIRKYALSKKVLAVAVINSSIKDWAAYIDAVPGVNHDVEKHDVTKEGTKLPYEIAKLLFPQVASGYKWRD